MYLQTSLLHFRENINTFEHDFQRTVMKSLIGLFYVVLEKNNLDMMKCH